MTTKGRSDPDRAALDASTRRWMIAGLVLMASLVAAFPIFRIYEPARRADARTRQEQYRADQGGDVFATNCESCHGPGRRHVEWARSGRQDTATDIGLRSLTTLN